MSVDAMEVLDGPTRLAEASEVAEAPRMVDGATALRLSRFAWIRCEDGVVLAESARMRGTVALLHPAALAFGWCFHAPATVAQAGRRAGIASAPAERLAAVLVACGVLIAAGDRAEQELPLAVWEFHDLLFHARSRPGRHGNPTGGTYRFAGHLDEAPPLPPSRWPVAVELERPDLDRLEREDPPLSAVLAARRSVREYADTPITAAQVGEFLHRVLRIDDILTVPVPGRVEPSMVLARPYPSGGGVYELECYVVIGRCEGIEPGLYHYSAGEHELELVRAGSDEELAEFTARQANGAMVASDRVQVLLLITARMHRIAWKYASIAYALVLKHVGVLVGHMYLAATAMGLAPCAIGTGDSDEFASLSGIDAHEEALVGEFLLATPAERYPLP